MPRIFPIITRPAGHYEPVRPAPAQWINRTITFTMPFGADATSQGVLNNPAIQIPVELQGDFASDPGVWRSLAKGTWAGGRVGRNGVKILPSLTYSTTSEMPTQFKAIADTPVQFDWGLDVDAT